jgi:hypothetical protein
MPSWFDPTEACSDRFGIDEADVNVTTGIFPPRATCTFNNVSGQGTRVVHDYISPGKSALLTVMIVVLMLATVAGLALLSRRLLWRDASSSNPQDRAGLSNEQVGVWLRVGAHLLAVWLLGVFAVAFGPYTVFLAAFIVGWPASAALSAMIVLAVIVIAAVIDIAVGPGRGGSVGSRRRATVLGVLGSATVLALLIARAEGGAVASLPLPEQLPVGLTSFTITVALIFPVVAAAQWVWKGRRADG